MRVSTLVMQGKLGMLFPTKIYNGVKVFKGSVWSKKSVPFFAENMTIRSILNLGQTH